MSESELQRLRMQAISHSLFPTTTLKTTTRRLGFVQADPIQAPARAQDLILRHRVNGYRAGDLERRYPLLDLEEGVLYAYGFMPRAVWELLHPRRAVGLTTLESKVLAIVLEAGETHPSDMDAHYGRETVRNDWGGYSKATKRALESLHRRGLLRIARREKGIRIYQPAVPIRQELSPQERVRRLVMVVARIFAPAQKKSLLATLAPIGRSVIGDNAARMAVNELLGSGALQEASFDGVAYIWPSAIKFGESVPDSVRMLAPFDPLIWDRRRFEHLWGWAYRFEAYTVPSKRLRGYYAMPLLWRDRIIGWSNASLVDGRLNVECGFVGKQPREPRFQAELECEIARMQTFFRIGAASP